MCGICGIVSKNKKVERDSLQAMCRELIHRGPDDEGMFIKHGAELSVGLGHRRLSIIDLSKAAHQPISNEDGSVLLVLNGEIYNYQKLREDLINKGHRFKSNTDSEVVLHLYEDFGEECVSYLRGMFAFAIWDTKDSKLFLVRDRLGQKPLNYHYANGDFCFASEFSSLLASGLVAKEVNRSMIDPYLSFGYIPAPHSIYENVYKLLPGHIAVYKDGKLATRPYWKLNYQKKINIDEVQAKEELKRIITEAVSLRLQSDVPLGVFLSGGLDSSMVVGIMARLKTKIKTFSIGFTESAYNELSYAKEVAKRYQTEHHELIVTPKTAELIPLLVRHYGEPYADSSALPSYCVARETRKFVTVALNGDGGDESFVGYDRYQAMYLAQAYCLIPHLLREKVLNKIFNRFPDSIHFHSNFRKIRRFIKGTELPWQKRYMRWSSIFSQELKNDIYNKKFRDDFTTGANSNYLEGYLSNFGRLDLLDTLLLTDICTYLPNDLLVKVDIATMANSLEGRSPFLDHHVVEFMASLPAKLKFKRLTKKYLFKEIAKEYLPKEIIFRRKAGFGVPVGYWFRNELKGFVTEHLLSSKFFNRGYFNRLPVENLIKQHLDGKVDYTSQIWTLLMLELWHQEFID